MAQCNPLVPKALCDIIHQCLQFNAENRPERMSEVQGKLDKLADQLGAPTDEDDE